MVFSESERHLWSNIIVPFGLFILLAPGSLLTFPTHSAKRCSDMIPFPKKYAFVKGDGEGYSEDQNITSDTLTSPGMSPILEARKKCSQFVGRSFSFPQILLHAILFTFLCTILRHFLE